VEIKMKKTRASLLRRGCKKGFIFTMDAFLASTVLIAGLMLLSLYSVSESPKESIQYTSTDILTALSELRMGELPPNVLNYYVVSSIYTNENLTILEQIGTYWAINQTTELSLATNLSTYFLEGLVQNNTGLELNINFNYTTQQLFRKDVGQKVELHTANRMITGVEQGREIEGSTSSAYLRKITDKRTSSYAYLGGFVGQGNITVLLDVPEDVTSGTVTKMVLEGDFGSNFSLYINGNNCGNFSPKSLSNMTPDNWAVTGCNASVLPGNNNVSLTFNDLNGAYVAGGFFRVDYKTDELGPGFSVTNSTYHFPDIRGVVNLYDSFYIPGNLTSMTLYLHYIANHSVLAFNNTFYLTIGNSTIFADTDSTTERSLTFTNAIMSSLLNYSSLNTKTVPLRMGFENLSYESQLIGNSQVMLVTDRSGSMDWNMTYGGSSWVGGYPSSCPGNPACGVKRECGDALINASSTQRLSVAKCLGKQFAVDVLDVIGNTIGLVSYDDATNGDIVAPTTNDTRINATIGNSVPQTGYSAGGSTCICCGINSARNQLITGSGRTVLIASSSSWKYENQTLLTSPSNDSNGNAWYTINYDDSAWPSGNAVLGHNTSGGGVNIATQLGSANASMKGLAYVDMWENAGDTIGPPNDFTSNILNSTGNTFGIGGANDGWDWMGSSYGYDNKVDFNGAVNGQLNLDFRAGGAVNKNTCTAFSCSGAYGISISITPAMLNMIQNNGSAKLSFYYSWNISGGSNFQNQDEVWIKARLWNPDGSVAYLGTSLDSGHTGSDSDLEIANAENPGMNFQGNALVDLTKLVNSSGVYYIDFGAKLKGHRKENYGYAYLDNIQIRVDNGTDDHYYFRKHFTLADTSVARRGVLNLMSDDIANVYLNGNPVFAGTQSLNGTYWDVLGTFVDGTFFKTGDNVVAVELLNMNASARFDLELTGVNTSNQAAILLMTDGQANQECNGAGGQGATGDLDGDGTADTASDDAIQAACDARRLWGLQVFAVGFSQAADLPTLQGIANCGGGLYAKSDNTSVLSDFYNQVVLNIISATVRSQTIIVSSGTPAASNIFGDSYLEYTYTEIVDPPRSNEIGVSMQTPQFNSCNPVITISPGIRVIDSKITTYSGEHWTKLLKVNGINVFNLSEYNGLYTFLGDPYIIQIPPNLLNAGPNTLYVETGDGPTNSTGCSVNNTMIYTALVPSTTSRSDVYPYLDGCQWTIQFEDDTNSTKPIPSTYAGAKQCYYTAANFNPPSSRDAYDISVYNLLKVLDFDNNGKIFVNLDAEDIEIVVTTISAVPYMWGPSLIKAEVWQ
jgi:hypothetical protein